MIANKACTRVDIGTGHAAHEALGLRREEPPAGNSWLQSEIVHSVTGEDPTQHPISFEFQLLNLWGLENQVFGDLLQHFTVRFPVLHLLQLETVSVCICGHIVQWPWLQGDRLNELPDQGCDVTTDRSVLNVLFQGLQRLRALVLL